MSTAQQGDMQQQPGSWSPSSAPSYSPAAGNWTAAPQAPQAAVQPQLPSAEVAGQMAQQAAVGFFSALTDFSFTSYIAPRLAKLLYGLVILAAIGVVFAGVGNGVSQLFSTYGRVSNAVISIALAPLSGIGVLLVGRLYLELVTVMFRIAELLSEINKKSR